MKVCMWELYVFAVYVQAIAMGAAHTSLSSCSSSVMFDTVIGSRDEIPLSLRQFDQAVACLALMTAKAA